jgi:hypothetical protein
MEPQRNTPTSFADAVRSCAPNPEEEAATLRLMNTPMSSSLREEDLEFAPGISEKLD